MDSSLEALSPIDGTAEALFTEREELWRLEGRTVIQEINSLGGTVRVFNGNTGELRDFLGKFAEPPLALPLMAPGNEGQLERFLNEVVRLLHNFVAAAISLRDHTYRVQAKLLPENPADNLTSEFQARISEAFGDAPVSCFVYELRQYTLHNRLPIARGQIKGVTRNMIESRVILHGGELLRRRKRWNALARQYIEAAEGSIPLDDVVAEYGRLVSGFHVWFRAALEQRHQAALEEFDRRQQDFARRWKEATGDPSR